MTNSMLNILQKLNFGIKRNRILWLETLYYTVPFNILDCDPNLKFSYKCGRSKQFHVDTVFETEFERISELQFRVLFTRVPQIHSMLPGEYAFQFQCDTNIFNEDPKTIEMQSSESLTYVDFLLNASYRQDILLHGLRKLIELKVVIQMVEYDYVYPSDISQQLEELRKTNEVFYNESVVIDLCSILQIQRLEDVFAGREGVVFAKPKTFYISQAATFSREILNYMRSEKGTCTVTNLELLLNNLVNDKEERLADKDLLGVHYDAKYLGFKFLADLSRDCLLNRLSEHEIDCPSAYEYLLTSLLKTAVQLNDEYLFDKCAEMLFELENEHLVLANFLKKLKTCVHSRFVLYSLERRLKNKHGKILLWVQPPEHQNISYVSSVVS